MTTTIAGKITGVFSISHEKDLDGIVSAAIVRRYANKMRLAHSLMLTDYNVFESDFSAVSSLKNMLIVITDLGFNIKSLDSVLSRLNDAISHGCRLVWLDHHTWPKQCINAIMSLENNPVLKIRTDVCASEIAHRVLMPDDTVSESLAALAHDSDFNLRQSEAANVLNDVVNLLRIFSIEKRQRSTDVLASLVIALSENGLSGVWNEETQRLRDDLLEKRLQNYRRGLLKKMRRALEGHQDMEIHGKLVRIVEIPAGISTTDMGNFLSDPENLRSDGGQLSIADLLITLGPTGLLGFRRGNESVLCHKAAQLFDGGGHPYAAGGEYGIYSDFEAACSDIFYVLSTDKNWIQSSTSSDDSESKE